jgi:hypothetical protein
MIPKLGPLSSYAKKTKPPGLRLFCRNFDSDIASAFFLNAEKDAQKPAQAFGAFDYYDLHASPCLSVG